MKQWVLFTKTDGRWFGHGAEDDIEPVLAGAEQAMNDGVEYAILPVMFDLDDRPGYLHLTIAESAAFLRYVQHVVQVCVAGGRWHDAFNDIEATIARHQEYDD